MTRPAVSPEPSPRSRLRAVLGLPAEAGAAPATEGPRRLRLQMIRATGTLNLVSLLATLARLGLPPGGAAPVPPLLLCALAVSALLLLGLVWALPWGRLPAATALPLQALGLGIAAILIAQTDHPAVAGLLLLWVWFAVAAYPFLLGLAVTGAVAALGLGLALATGGRGELVDQLALRMPAYLIVYLLGKFVVHTLNALIADTAIARGAAARLAALYDFSTLLSSERKLDRLLTALVEGLATTFGYRYVSVFLLDDGQLALRAQVGYVTPITRLALGEGITGLVAREARPLLVRDGREHPNYLFAEEHFGSQASVPLLFGGRVVGVLNLEDGVGKLTDDDLRLLETLAAPVAAAIENARLLAQLGEQAHRDPLTGLLNRRGILAALRSALETAPPGADGRGGAPAPGPVSILLVDFNGFKLVNDRYGHAAGDALLVELAGLLAASVRGAARGDGSTPDGVGRLGGDEFLVVLPGTDEFAALGVVERLNAALGAGQFALLTATEGGAPPPAVGYSLGLATAPEDGADANTLLQVADRAMYRAKRHDLRPIRFLGRDRSPGMTG